MTVTLYCKGEGWFETSPYGVMADRYGTERGGGGIRACPDPPPDFEEPRNGRFLKHEDAPRWGWIPAFAGMTVAL